MGSVSEEHAKSVCSAADWAVKRLGLRGIRAAEDAGDDIDST